MTTYTISLRIIKRKSISNRLRRLFGFAELESTYHYTGDSNDEFSGLAVYRRALAECDKRGYCVLGFPGSQAVIRG